MSLKNKKYRILVFAYLFNLKETSITLENSIAIHKSCSAYCSEITSANLNVSCTKLVSSDSLTYNKEKIVCVGICGSTAMTTRTNTFLITLSCLIVMIKSIAMNN